MAISGPKAFVTGGTGMVGSHLVERLIKEGYKVKALVRPKSDLSVFAGLDVETCVGDITDSPQVLKPMVSDCEYLFHIAAMVDDWASREEMYRANVTATQNLMDACIGGPLKRFVMIGSMAVLGMGTQLDLDETAPYVYSGDNYNYTKIEAEKLVTRYAREKKFPVVTLRPPYIYGPRDRQFFSRVFTALRDKAFMYIGDGNNPFTIVFVKNLVEALVLAAKAPASCEGQIYQITDGVGITRRELVEMICDLVGYEKPTKSVPVGLAKALCPVFELIGKLLKKTPRLNKFRFKFMVPHMTFKIDKARRDLGYNPPHNQRDALKESILWYKEHHPEVLPKG
jgi:nucleoside-diphosphate-sugar epimerase